jgi:hypothetical protein
MTQTTPEQLENRADALELLNSEITASLARHVGSGQREGPGNTGADLQGNLTCASQPG